MTVQATSPTHADAVPWWRDAWHTRAQRPVALVFGAILVALGLHLVFFDRFSWGELLLLVVVTEIGALATCDTQRAPAPHVVAGMRRTAARMAAGGAALALAAAAIGFALRPLGDAGAMVFTAVALAGGLALVIGASLFYWSSPIVLRLSRASQPVSLGWMLSADVLLLAWSAFELIQRARAAGGYAPLRVVGFAALVAGAALATVAHMASLRTRTPSEQH